MSKNSLGTLVVDLVAKMGGFDEGLSKADRRMKRTADTIDKHAKRAAKAIAGIGLAAAGATAALIKSQANRADATLKAAERFGTTTEELTKMRYAAQMMSDMAEGNFDTAMRRMIRRVSEAAQGGGAAAGALEELKLDAEDLAAMKPEEVFHSIADAMQGVDRQNDRLRLAFS